MQLTESNHRGSERWAAYPGITTWSPNQQVWNPRSSAAWMPSRMAPRSPHSPFAGMTTPNSATPHPKLSTVTLTAADVIVRPVTPTIGAEISGVDLATAPDDEQVMKSIEQALYDHLVLFFRNQDITDEQQVRFAGWFGPYEHHPFAIHDA